MEVKARPSEKLAREALGYHQTQRIIRAAAIWRSGRPSLHALDIRYDLVLVTPWRWPRHERSAWVPDDQRGRDLL